MWTKEKMLQYFPADDSDAGKWWVPRIFNDNFILLLGVKIHDQLIELSADKTLQLEFSSEELDKCWLTLTN
jgi:hypothetical protein